MSTLLVFCAGMAVGSIIVGVFIGMWLVDRDAEVYDAGRDAGRDDLARWHRPIDEVPDWESRNHPARRRTDRAMSDLTAVLGGLLCAALVLWASGMFGGL